MDDVQEDVGETVQAGTEDETDAMDPAVAAEDDEMDFAGAADDFQDDDYEESDYAEEETGLEAVPIAEAATSDRVVAGPAAYEPSERRGRTRRIGSDVQLEDINFKNVALLTRFLDNRGRLLSRRKTRVSAKIQRRVAREVKRARHLALLPFIADHSRIVRKRR